MRNPKRIPIIIKKLKKAWLSVPDWRLGQLISNLQGPGPQDVFHLSDEDCEKLIDLMIQDKGI